MRTNETTAIGLLVSYLKGEGVKYVFGIPGGALIHFYEAMFDEGGITPVLSKHEGGASFMADGYARASGKIGVCCATTGPGATNLVTGIACAYADSVPMLVLTGQVATSSFGKGAFQESTAHGIDIVDMFKTVTKSSVMIPSPEKTGEILRGAFRTALSGRMGPVHVNFPMDYMKKKVSSVVIPSSRYRITAGAFDREAVKRASAALLRAKKPVILAGSGVNISGAYEELGKLAEKLDIPVATTPKAKGVFPEDHILSLGVFGFGATLHSERYLLAEDTDLLLVVGTSLGEASTCTWDARLGAGRTLIQIDVDPEVIGNNYPVDCGICGDAKAVLRELNFQLERDLRAGGEGKRSGLDAIREFRKFTPRHMVPEKMYSGEVPLKPQRVMKELREVLPADTVLFVDAGTSVFWAFHYFPSLRPGNFFVNTGCFSMGHGTAACIGGKLARPDQPMVALVGDASFAMNGMEVHTAVELGLPIVWVVLNNGGYGMIYHGERMLYGDKFTTSVYGSRLNIAEIAKGLGALSYHAKAPGEVGELVSEAIKSGKPSVVEVDIDLYERPPMGNRMKTFDKIAAPAVKEPVDA